MVAIVQRYANALASGLVPLLSTLSAGTEMASYGPAQWEFLLDSDGVTTFVAVNDDNDNGDGQQQHQPLLGCLLRIDMDQHQHQPQHPPPSATSSSSSGGEALAGFGMMLVGKEARGKGVAKKLLHEAMNNSAGATSVATRNLLAVCTSKGQPVYRKLGYAEVGRVTALKTTVGLAKDTSDAGHSETTDPGFVIRTHGSLDRNTGSSIDPAVVEMVAGMDAGATGWDRKGRICALLRNDPSRARRSVVAIATKGGSDNSEEPIGAAVLRREGPGSPLVVGPLLGNQETALPLVSALARSVGSDDFDDQTTLSLLVSDHPGLVDRFRGAGFSVGFDLPAMSLDDRPVYEHGDGSYLGLIHPTLG